MTRTDARELLMQAVFQMEAQKDSSNQLFELLIDERNPDKSSLSYLRTNFENIRRNIDEIDNKIDEFAKGRGSKRMPKSVLAVLRAAIGEMLYYDTPNPIVINEAVEIAKKYCGDDDEKFINGVLGSIERSIK